MSAKNKNPTLKKKQCQTKHPKDYKFNETNFNLGVLELNSFECETHGLFRNTIQNFLRAKIPCKKCSVDKKKLSLNEINGRYRSYGVRCIDNDYVNAHEKLKWVCSNNHQWEASVDMMQQRDDKCLYCAKKIMTIETIQLVAKELGLELISKSYINNVSPLKWKCKNDHIFSRTFALIKDNSKCPTCYSPSEAYRINQIKKGKIPLTESHPEIAKEWHPTKNNQLLPDHFTYGSLKEIWWLCEKGHEYKKNIYERTIRKSKCRICSMGDNKALKNYPDVFKEWHPTKNTLDPNILTFGSRHKAWWICPNNHVYEARVDHRCRSGSACPLCTHSSSKEEIRILTELKSILNVTSRYKINNSEVDIYIEKYKIGIEFDGWYWHKDRYEKDLQKNEILQGHLNYLIRIREKPLKKIMGTDIEIETQSLSKSTINQLLLKIEYLFSNEDKEKVNNYIRHKEYVNEDIYLKYLSYFPNPFPENSLEEKFPEIAKEWHPTKNNILRPINFAYGASFNAWWQCKNGHEWQESINNRTNKKKDYGCYKCKSGLQQNFPEIAKEWHPSKNLPLKLIDMKFGSDKKVWWVCAKGHEYEAKINKRTTRNRNCLTCKREKGK